MAIYRFRITFEDYEEVYRDIDVLSKHTFLDLHHAIHSSTQYDVEKPSSFYVSNDQWKKGEEIAYLPNVRKSENGVLLMEDCKLSKFINDPHQKFYYIYDFGKPYDFHVQLIKILKEEEGVEYPQIFKSVGNAPKIIVFAAPSEGDEDDFDEEDDKDGFAFEAELDYDEEDNEEGNEETEEDVENSDSGPDFGEEY